VTGTMPRWHLSGTMSRWRTKGSHLIFERYRHESTVGIPPEPLLTKLDFAHPVLMIIRNCSLIRGSYTAARIGRSQVSSCSTRRWISSLGVWHEGDGAPVEQDLGDDGVHHGLAAAEPVLGSDVLLQVAGLPGHQRRDQPDPLRAGFIDRADLGEQVVHGPAAAVGQDSQTAQPFLDNVALGLWRPYPPAFLLRAAARSRRFREGSARAVPRFAVLLSKRMAGTR
jgi:hypothetical protein